MSKTVSTMPDLAPSRPSQGSCWLLSQKLRLASNAVLTVCRPATSPTLCTDAIALTRNVDLELATLAEGTVDNALLPRGQLHLKPHKELDVGLLFEQGASNHTVVIHYLSPHRRGGISSACGELALGW